MGTSHTLEKWQLTEIQTKIKTQDSSIFPEPIFLERVSKTPSSVMFLSIAYIAIGES